MYSQPRKPGIDVPVESKEKNQLQERAHAIPTEKSGEKKNEIVYNHATKEE